MNSEQFSQAYVLVQEKLLGLEVNHAFNSIGSHVFFDFGAEIQHVSPKGKKWTTKEWSIYLGNTSWRLTQNNQYLIGSGDPTSSIEPHILSLIGKRFQSLKILSQFLDAEFSFEEGYRLTTFFNWKKQDQWTLFAPVKPYMSVDCETSEEIESIQKVAKWCPLFVPDVKLIPLQGNLSLEKIVLGKKEEPLFYFEQNIIIHLNSCGWRLERNQNYVIGCLDNDPIELNALIGKRLAHSSTLNPMMDAQFEFEGGYILKTFSCCRQKLQWEILQDSKSIFLAEMPL